MALSFEQMMDSPNLPAITRNLARAFVERHQTDRRQAAVFANQQRWLLAHAALAIHCRGLTGDGPGLHSTAFLDLVQAEKIAARHTAHVFLKEMLNYGIITYLPETKDTKTRLIGVSDAAFGGITYWLTLHLEALDAFDRGSRGQLFQRNPMATAWLHPELAGRLFASARMRVPAGAFSVFIWVTNGGLVMDLLMMGLQPEDDGAEQILTSITSTSEIAEKLGLSRTHLGRKLRDAEELGSIGWIGSRGKSAMWLSKNFRDEYYAYQAGKLAIIDGAFDAVAPRLV